ncbi:spliceosome-associated protein CWC27 homolog [Ischnura elegans]|uniref:spliceosome-associated protein CWC27 homolog n=1 Tax=Ischnura elegans TaxID=197161 RepID=UPI001ED8A1F8|nr:spliceosome-associated protein CWC27 homolog [Ischnura elegans]
MSNIYIQEPPTSGKVLLETTVGDIDIELWAKETPKACRNFIQLCMEGYYNGTIFHRVIKGFIVQGGDPKGDGTGGESIYGKPFQDELHSRLRFNRRGLIAMCNGGIPHDNGSQFFFTLAACPHLQGKHTIFGKVMGETLFNMLKLEDSLVDHDDKPMYPHKILKAVVLSNPFPDMVPRVLPNSVKSGEDEDEGGIGRKKKDKKSRSGVKDFKLLSFGAEAEEDEEEVAEVNKKFANKGKSTHDLLSDPKLSSEPAVEPKDGEDSDESGSEEDDVESGNEKWANNQQSHSERAERIRNKLREAKKNDAPVIPSGELEEDEEEEYSLNQDKKRESSKRAEEIREEIRRLKREMKGEKKAREDLVDTKAKAVEKTKEELKEAEKNELLKNYMEEHECFTAKHQKIPPKGSKREAHTMSMLKNFHKRLKMAKEKVLEEGDDADEDLASKDTLDDKEDLDGHASDNWLVHKLQGDEEKTVLARDANKAKGDEWFEIHDPRNPINQRRREASKQAMLSKKASSLAKQAQLK